MILPVRGTLSLFSVPVECYDIVSSRVNGRVLKTVFGTRTIKGSIQANNGDFVTRKTEGFLSDGDLILSVLVGVVYYFDNPTDSNRQTIVVFNDNKYLVNEELNLTIYNQNIKHYKLIKYTEVE